MAGGTITRISLGNSSTVVEGSFEGFYENLTMNAGKENRFTAKVTNHGNPKEPEKKEGYFVKGWWSADVEGNQKIREALVGETVYFHLETRDIPDGEAVFMSLYDDDVKRANEEQDNTEGSDKIELYPIGTTDHSKDNESKYGVVNNNKVVREILLNDYFAKLIEEEEDKAIELFFACSYNGQNIELPLSFGDYLKVKEAEPLIIFVNGYWNTSWIQKDLFGFSDGKKLEEYWGKGLKESAMKYTKMNKENLFFINGADIALSSGIKRFNSGKNFAKERLNNEKSRFFKEVFKVKRKITVISHSMGASFTEGMLSILKIKNVVVEKVVHFSPADVSEFSATFPDRTYQIDISIDPVLMFKNINDEDYIKNIKYAALIQNPDHDQYGHANTKLEGYVWNWFEDLEGIILSFSHEETSYRIIDSDLGPSKTIPIKKAIYIASNLKYNTQFMSIVKEGKLYQHSSHNIYYSI